MVITLERIRSFIAIDIEDNSILDKLSMVQNALARSGAKLKLVERENIHITIRFLGNIPLILIDDIAKIIESAKRPKFKIEIRGVGAFPSLNRPRVVWAGVGCGAEIIEEIHRKIEIGLKKLGFKSESEKFVPHITLARIKSGRNVSEIVRVLHDYRDAFFGEMLVEHIRLKKSTLTSRGPIYSTLREISLT